MSLDCAPYEWLTWTLRNRFVAAIRASECPREAARYVNAIRVLEALYPR